MASANSLTDYLISLIIGMFVLIIIYVTVVADYINNNLTGNIKTMAEVAVLFMFLALALGAIFMAIKRK